MKIIRWTLYVFIAVAAILLTASWLAKRDAIGTSVYLPRGFDFHMDWDNQHASVLNYELWGEKETAGREKTLIDRAPPDLVQRGVKMHGGDSMGYQYVRPTLLYVKWQDDPTGKVYEKSVDLRNALPKDLGGTRLYFNIYGSELFVYLSLPDIRQKGEPVIGTMDQDHVNIQLYPNLANR